MRIFARMGSIVAAGILCGLAAIGCGSKQVVVEQPDLTPEEQQMLDFEQQMFQQQMQQSMQQTMQQVPQSTTPQAPQ